MVQWQGLSALTAGPPVRSLIRELRFHKSCDVAKKKKKCAALNHSIHGPLLQLTQEANIASRHYREKRTCAQPGSLGL